jgi:hypothetical protein
VNAYDNNSGTVFIDIVLGPGGTDPAWVEMCQLVYRVPIFCSVF